MPVSTGTGETTPGCASQPGSSCDDAQRRRPARRCGTSLCRLDGENTDEEVIVCSRPRGSDPGVLRDGEGASPRHRPAVPGARRLRGVRAGTLVTYGGYNYVIQGDGTMLISFPVGPVHPDVDLLPATGHVLRVRDSAVRFLRLPTGVLPAPPRLPLPGAYELRVLVRRSSRHAATAITVETIPPGSTPRDAASTPYNHPRPNPR